MVAQDESQVQVIVLQRQSFELLPRKGLSQSGHSPEGGRKEATEQRDKGTAEERTGREETGRKRREGARERRRGGAETRKKGRREI